MSQIDTHVSLANVVTGLVLVFGTGAAWASVKSGMNGIKNEIEQMRKETMRRDVSEAKMDALRAEMERFQERMNALERGRKSR